MYFRLQFFAEGFFNFSGDNVLLEVFSRRQKCFSACTRYVQKYLGYDLEDAFVSRFEYESIVNIFTVLFNLKRWQRSLNKFFHEEELGFAEKCWYYFKAVLFSFVYIVLISFILLLLIIDALLSSSWFFLGSLIYAKRETNSYRVWYYIKRLHAVFLTLSIFLFSLYLCSYLPYITLLFFAGLILNAVYFSPYVTFITILIFYSWTFWQDVETKYSTLKMQIYEVCKDSGLTFGSDDDDIISFDAGDRPIPHHSVGLNNVGNNGNDGDDDNRGNNHDNEPMILKQFYDRIREKILPYNLILLFLLQSFLCVSLRLLSVYNSQNFEYI